MKKVNRGKYNMLSEVESAKKMALNTPGIASHTVLSCVLLRFEKCFQLLRSIL